MWQGLKRQQQVRLCVRINPSGANRARYPTRYQTMHYKTPSVNVSLSLMARDHTVCGNNAQQIERSNSLLNGLVRVVISTENRVREDQILYRGKIAEGKLKCGRRKRLTVKQLNN